MPSISEVSKANASQKLVVKTENLEVDQKRTYSEKRSNVIDVSLSALHVWVTKRYKKKKKCERCKTAKAYDLANKGIYDRNLSNWEWLCRRCHMREDGRLEKIRQYGLESRLSDIECGWCKKQFKPLLNKIKFCGTLCSAKFVSFKRFGDKLRTDTPQTRYRLRKLKMGICGSCTKPLANATLCQDHINKVSERRKNRLLTLHTQRCRREGL
jgi:hypothetical protein